MEVELISPSVHSQTYNHGSFVDSDLMEVKVWGIVPVEYEKDIMGETEVIFRGVEFTLTSFESTMTPEGNVVRTVTMQCVMTKEQWKEFDKQTLKSPVGSHRYFSDKKAETEKAEVVEPLEFDNAIDSLEL